MKPNEIISQFIMESRIPLFPFSTEEASASEVVEYFTMLWDQYYSKGIDEAFARNRQLRKLWFCLRVRCLLELVKEGDSKAMGYLDKELEKNGTFFKNPKFSLVSIFAE